MVDSVSSFSPESRDESASSEHFRMSPSTLGMNFCSACGVTLDARAAVCPKCGVLQHNTVGQGHPNAVLALVLNIFFPGVGTLVLGETKIGVIQLTLWLISIPLLFVLIGFPLSFGVWIWAIVTAAQSFSRAPGWHNQN
jgi:TM2 domain-containing membrane protein YozV